MKNRLFRTLATGFAAAGVVVFSLQGSAIGAEVSPVTPEAEGQGDSRAAKLVSVSLDYHEVGFSFNDTSLPVTARKEPFKKELAAGWGDLVRGSLNLGGAGTHDVGFAWDRGAGKLYLDLNRNLDLTDDPGGVFSDRAGRREVFQTFTNVHLPCKTFAGTHPVLMDLKFYFHKGANCSAQMRSFWQAKVVLQGEEWQVGLLEGRYSPQYGSSVGSSLLLRPWAERNQRFSCLFNNDSLAAFPFTEKVFFGGRGYRLQCTNEIQGENVKVRMQFTEQRPKLGELKVTGSYVHRVMLQSGPYLVLVDKPEGVVKVPVGEYGDLKVWLKKGDAEACPGPRWGSEGRGITVSGTKPAVLTAGGPLTNSVSISSRGRHLRLNYELLGQGGRHQLANQDRSHPPEFAVYQGDRKIASGKFEFG
jgi:hypothetical protein